MSSCHSTDRDTSLQGTAQQRYKPFARKGRVRGGWCCQLLTPPLAAAACRPPPSAASSAGGRRWRWTCSGGRVAWASRWRSPPPGRSCLHAVWPVAAACPRHPPTRGMRP